VCGILGILYSNPQLNTAPEICEGLYLLQHRGQDACGIVTCGPKGRFYQCKATGMVRDVLDSTSVSRLIGGMGVGHGAILPLIIRFSPEDAHGTVQLDTLPRALSITQKHNHSTLTLLTV
jgi:glucosamine 6-phosphate synthetase-like amidotransferase/phosphosugar isomerase protein